MVEPKGDVRKSRSTEITTFGSVLSSVRVVQCPAVLPVSATTGLAERPSAGSTGYVPRAFGYLTVATSLVRVALARRRPV